jgi:hypothetical protein
VHADGNRLATIELARPGDDVVFGIFVEITIAERIGIEAVEELSCLSTRSSMASG